MTEVDNYLFKNEPDVYKKPRIYSERWEQEQNIQNEMYEDVEMTEPTPGASSSSSSSIPIIPSSSQSTRQIIQYTPQLYELASIKTDLAKLFENKIEKHIS